MNDEKTLGNFSLFLICLMKAQTVLEVQSDLIDLMVNHDFDRDK